MYVMEVRGTNMATEIVMYKATDGSVHEDPLKASMADLSHLMARSGAISDTSAKQFVEKLRCDFDFREDFCLTVEELQAEFRKRTILEDHNVQD